MSREASGVIQLQFLGTLLNVLSANVGDQVPAPWGEALAAVEFSTGVEDDQINRAIGKRTNDLASGSQLLLDVFDFAGMDVGGGDGRDMVGQPMALDEIVGLMVVLRPGSAGTLKIGGEGSGACWNSLFDGNDNARAVIRATNTNPGIFLALCPNVLGWDVADVSNHLLKFEAVGGDCEFGWAIIGRDNP